jgi:hypothetical protein
MDNFSLSRALSRAAQTTGRSHGGKSPGASRKHTVAPVSSRGTICEPVGKVSSWAWETLGTCRPPGHQRQLGRGRRWGQCGGASNWFVSPVAPAVLRSLGPAAGAPRSTGTLPEEVPKAGHLNVQVTPVLLARTWLFGCAFCSTCSARQIAEAC